MLNYFNKYINPNTASVLTKITSMIDALDEVNVRHTQLGIKHSDAAEAATAKADAAFAEAGVANTAAKKIAAAFGVER